MALKITKSSSELNLEEELQMTFQQARDLASHCIIVFYK